MSHFRSLSRRGALAGAATLAMPAIGGAQAAPIKVGLIHPVTGALAGAGGRCRAGGLMAIEDINAAGGIKSMGGAKLEAILGDAQGRPEIATQLVDQMAEAGAAGFTGCFASALGLAATQAAAKYNIPFSIDSGIADAITTRGLKNTFRFFPNNSTATADAMAALGALNKAAGSPAKTAVIVHEDSEFGTNSVKLQAAMLPGIGIEVKALLPHATPTRDFTNIVLRIKAEKPDIVLISNYENEYVLLARTLVQQRVDLVSTFSISGGGFNNIYNSQFLTNECPEESTASPGCTPLRIPMKSMAAAVAAQQAPKAAAIAAAPAHTEAPGSHADRGSPAHLIAQEQKLALQQNIDSQPAPKQVSWPCAASPARPPALSSCAPTHPPACLHVMHTDSPMRACLAATDTHLSMLFCHAPPAGTAFAAGPS